MPFPNPVIFTDKDASRIAPVLDGLDPQDFIAGDLWEFVEAGKLWQRDDADVSSPSDGVTVWVTSDSVRFKSNGINSPERGYCSVKSFVDQVPAEAALAEGDVYGIAAAPAAGLFAGHGNEIATCLKAGPAPIFKFTVPPWPGFFVWDASLPGYRHWTGAAWSVGLGLVYADASIAPEAQKVPRFVTQAIVTEPPGAPADDLYWLAGTGCTGAFAGWDNRIVKRAAGAWQSYAAATGWKALVLADGIERSFLGGAWVAVGQPKVAAYPAPVARSATVALANSATQTTAPTNAAGAAIFPEGAAANTTWAMAKAANRMALRLRLDLTGASGLLGFALFLDGEVTCAPGNWRVVSGPATAADCSFDLEFDIAPGDTAVHVYRIRGYGAGTIERATLQPIERTP